MDVLFDDEMTGHGKTFDEAVSDIVGQFKFKFDLFATTAPEKSPRMGQLVQKNVKIVYTLDREQPAFQVKFRVQIFGQREE